MAGFRQHGPEKLGTASLLRLTTIAPTRLLPTVADSQKSCALRIVQPSLEARLGAKSAKLTAREKSNGVGWTRMCSTDEENQDNKWRDCINSPGAGITSRGYRVKPGDTPTDPMAREKAAQPRWG